MKTIPELRAIHAGEEKQLIKDVLESTSGFIHEAARKLDVPYTVLWRAIKRHQLQGMAKKERKDTGYKGVGKPAAE